MIMLKRQLGQLKIKETKNLQQQLPFKRICHNSYLNCSHLVPESNGNFCQYNIHYTKFQPVTKHRSNANHWNNVRTNESTEYWR